MASFTPFSGKKPEGDQPVFHRGYFNVSNPKDTYLDMRDGWKKGVVWVNGRNLGRFWFIGSQQALYCPGEYLKPGKNETTDHCSRGSRLPEASRKFSSAMAAWGPLSWAFLLTMAM